MGLVVVFVYDDEHVVILNAQVAKFLAQIVVEIRVVQEPSIVTDTQITAVSEFRLQNVFDKVAERGS